MANSSQARKRVRQTAKRTLQNQSQKTETRTYIKRVVKSLAAGNKELAIAAFKRATQLLDRLANRGLVHANKAARLKSRLNKKIKAAA